MQMKIGVVGFGFGIPKTALQVSAVQMAKLYFKATKSDRNIIVLDVNDMFCIGKKSTTFLISGLETAWFDLDPTKESWACNAVSLIGKRMEISVEGLLLFRGKVDISVALFDQYGQSKTLVKQSFVKTAGGIQASGIKIRGVAAKNKLLSGRQLKSVWDWDNAKKHKNIKI
jgi:hypothetical protein